MKKFTFIIVAMIICHMSFGQSVKKNPYGLITKDGKTSVTHLQLKHSSTKATYLTQGFDTNPLEWSQQNMHATNNWFAGNPQSSNFTTIDATSVSSALISYVAANCNEIIYSGAIDATGSTNLQLSFYCGYSGPYMIGGSQAAGNGADVRAVISTDGGTTWNQLWSYSDTHLGTENWAWELVEINLQATYGGNSNLIIGFQYYGYDGDLAAIDGVMVEDYVAPTYADFRVVAEPLYTMLPLNHAIYTLGATVYNDGADLATEQTLNVSVTPGSYTSSITIPVPFVEDNDSTFTAPGTFFPDATGTYTATFAAPLTDDPTPANNTSTVSFNVTDATFAADNGIMVGGIGNTAPITFGNLFYLLTQDVIKSFSIGFNEITAEQDFTVSIYSVDLNTFVATHVFTSSTLTKTVAMSGLITEFDIENQNLSSGLYFFAINQIDANNISVGYDGVQGGQVYILNTSNNTLGYNSSFGNVVIRVNTTAEVSSTTCDLAALFMTSNTDPTPIASSVTIGANDDVTVYPGILNNGPDATNANAVIDVTINGTNAYNATLPLSGEYSIPSNSGGAFMPNGYTVTAEEMNTNGLTGTFDVCMTITYAETDPVATNNTTCLTVTRIIDNVENNIANSISIYPNPASDVVTVKNAENANIVIVNMIGDVVATVENASAIESINISNLANGTYFVRVNAEVFKFNVVK